MFGSGGLRRALGLAAAALALGSCSANVTWQSSGDVGCTLEPVTGYLVDQGGRTVLIGAAFQGPAPPGAPMGDLVVRWPAGWTVRSTGAALEVENDTGKREARTGEFVSVYAASMTTVGMPEVADGALLACPFGDVLEGHWPPSSEPSGSRDHTAETT